VPRTLRALLTLVAAAVVIAGGLTAVAAAVGSAVGNATSAQAAPLPPLAPAPLEPSTVYADDGTTVIATLHASARRVPVTLDQVSPNLIHAVLDTEDARFYIHGGVDIPSTLRALASDSSSSGGLQGGSTITQQLVKQTYLNSERKVSRKLKEAVLAERLQQKYTKNQILDAYLNTIYLGYGAYGVQAAANTYFNVDASQLTVPEAALLAGLIQDPNGYDPVLDANAARNRRSQVISRMVHYGTITRAQADAANATPLPTAVNVPPPTPSANSTYVDEVTAQLLGANSPIGGNYSERYAALFEGGLKIYTNFDPAMQAAASQATSTDMPQYYAEQGDAEAMVSIDPATGKVRAIVGGAPGSQFDVITQGQRQPGSGFKIFTLVAALEKGYNINDTILGSSPCAIDFPGHGGPGGPGPGNDGYVASPAHNDEGNGGGVETLTVATAQSTNCAYMRLAHETGLPAIVDVAHQLGISESLVGKNPAGPPNPSDKTEQYYPSMVIGAIPVKPMEMAAAYATLADDGVYHTPTFIDHVVDRTGATIYTGTDPGHRVLTPQIAEEATQAFTQVLISGTAAGDGLSRQAAGKTGTTENSDDAWFNGYTPQLESTVWMGSTKGETSMGNVYGGQYPATTWHDAMTQEVTNLPAGTFGDPGYLGPSTFITSPSLQADDKSAGGGSPGYGGNGANGAGNNANSYNGNGNNGTGYNGSGRNG
jgi:membrane peptidoglycan carboxypeptidase